jgi:hypothetical protein
VVAVSEVGLASAGAAERLKDAPGTG